VQVFFSACVGLSSVYIYHYIIRLNSCKYPLDYQGLDDNNHACENQFFCTPDATPSIYKYYYLTIYKIVILILNSIINSNWFYLFDSWPILYVKASVLEACILSIPVSCLPKYIHIYHMQHTYIIEWK